jgi:hypothetical protein
VLKALAFLPTPLGIGLIFAGLSVLTSTREAFLIFCGIALVLAAAIAIAAARRSRAGPAGDRTASDDLSHWRQFAAGRRRSAPLESVIYLLIAGGSIWVEGLSLGTILIVAGTLLLLTSRWLVEPRIWAEVTRRLAEL